MMTTMINQGSSSKEEPPNLNSKAKELADLSSSWEKQYGLTETIWYRALHNNFASHKWQI